MKRFAIILTVLAVALLLFSCSRTWVNKREDVSLHFVYGDINIHVALSGEEAERVIRILDGNIYEPPIGMPSCGFDEEICLKVGDQTFAVACDGCNGFAHVNKFRFFDVSMDDIAYIHSLFEKYGGFFPCV